MSKETDFREMPNDYPAKKLKLTEIKEPKTLQICPDSVFLIPNAPVDDNAVRFWGVVVVLAGGILESGIAEFRSKNFPV